MARKRVLFVCIGNSCRSQMAEGFARKYGADVVDAHSAGLSPAPIVALLTQKIMGEKNIDVSGHFPKGLEAVTGAPFDVVINISGQKMPVPHGVRVEEWKIRDPIGQSEEVYRQVANEIEQRVMRLILTLRTGAFDARKASPG